MRYTRRGTISLELSIVVALAADNTLNTRDFIDIVGLLTVLYKRRRSGARRMGLITGETETPPSSEKGVLGRLSAVTSVFSRKKPSATASTQRTPPPLPSPVTDSAKPEAPPLSNQPECPPQELPVAPPVIPPELREAEKEVPPVPASTAEARPQRLPVEEQASVTPAGEGPAAAGASKESVVKENTAQTVDPELKVIPFDVREPSLGAAVVGHVAIFEGSCYVWAATEGSAAQGSLAAAVGTRFDGGMPTATPLLAGAGPGESGAGGVSISMAQRLCKRTGRVTFVSCDLSEDSQILVAAVEAKVVALLKTED